MRWPRRGSNVPLVGASGAIAGVVAAYLMLRPCAKITVLLFGLVPLRLASYWVLGFWVLSQVWHVFSLEKSDTAWWAHVGGLAAGALLITGHAPGRASCCSSACAPRTRSRPRNRVRRPLGQAALSLMLHCVDRVLGGP